MKKLMTIMMAVAFATLPAQAESPPARSCKILFLKAPDGAPDKLFLYDGKEIREVELPRLNLSESYPLAPGDVDVVLLPKPPATPGEVTAAAPKIRVAAGISHCYLLITPDPSNTVAPVKISLIDASPSVLKAGQMLWFNLSDKTVGGRVGSRDLAIEPNSRTVLDAPAAKREEFNVNLAFRQQGKPALNPLCETKWSHDPTAKVLIFLVNEPGSRTPRVLGFPDREVAASRP